MRLPYSVVVQRAAHWVEVSQQRADYDPRVLDELRNAMAQYVAYVAEFENYQTEGALAFLANDYLLSRLRQRIAGEEYSRDQQKDKQRG